MTSTTKDNGTQTFDSAFEQLKEAGEQTKQVHGRTRMSIPSEAAELRALYENEKKINRGIPAILRRIGDMPATTPAGIYAKAIAVKASKYGASPRDPVPSG